MEVIVRINCHGILTKSRHILECVIANPRPIYKSWVHITRIPIDSIIVNDMRIIFWIDNNVMLLTNIGNTVWSYFINYRKFPNSLIQYCVFHTSVVQHVECNMWNIVWIEIKRGVMPIFTIQTIDDFMRIPTNCIRWCIELIKIQNSTPMIRSANIDFIIRIDTDRASSEGTPRIVFNIDQFKICCASIIINERVQRCFLTFIVIIHNTI